MSQLHTIQRLAFDVLAGPESRAERTVEYMSDFAPDQIERYYDQDVIMHDPALVEPIVGLEGIRSIIEMYNKAFPDITYKMRDVLQEGNRAVVRWSVSGTHKGDLNGLPPTNKRMQDVSGITILSFKEDKVIEIWQLWDRYDMMSKLGLLA